MSFFESNIENIKMGAKGESIVRELFKNSGFNFMQIDLIAYNNEKMYLCEIKTQEKFKAPPFDGHGLPKYQLEQRIRLSSIIGAIPLFVVYDVDDRVIYYQNMNTLLEGDSFITKNAKRIIFPMTSFITKQMPDSDALPIDEENK